MLIAASAEDTADTLHGALSVALGAALAFGGDSAKVRRLVQKLERQANPEV